MRRRLDILAYVLIAMASPSAAFEVRNDSTLSIHGRFETFVQADHSSSPFPSNHTSRSPVDFTRLMLDLKAGRPAWGTLYVKGTGVWRVSDDSAGRVPFSFDQGDYVWNRGSPGWEFQARAYANERRYFTGEMSAQILDDDVVSRYDTHYGARFDGDAGRLRWNALLAGLEDATNETRGIAWASAGWFTRHVQVSAGYLHDAPAADSLSDRGILKGEVSAFYRRASVVFSWEQAGVDGDFSGSINGEASGYTGIMPRNAATFAEIRLRRLRVGSWGLATLWGRYRSVGEDYANDLTIGSVPASITSDAGVYVNHRRYAIEGRFFYRRHVRYRFDDRQTDSVELHTHAYLQRGFEAFVRSSVGTRNGSNDPSERRYFVNMALRRTLRKFFGGAHLWTGNNEIGNFALRAAGEMRLNLGARSAFYARMVTNQDATSSDALYLRMELRPTPHVFATISYGRIYIGDSPYLLEDEDIGRTGPTDNVYTITVRGDF